MGLSKYNFYEDQWEKKGFGLIYNTNSGSVLKIGKKLLWEAIINADFAAISLNEQGLLQDNMVIVESRSKELEDIKSRYYSRIESKEELAVTIMPTEECNFACPYCFIYEKTKGGMSNQTYDDIYSFLENTLRSGCPQIKRMYINRFGGEPSLCADKIILFMKRLQNLALRYGIMLIGAITTNGYLINDARTEKCIECKLLPICMGGCMRNRLDSSAQCYWSEKDIKEGLERQAELI